MQNKSIKLSIYTTKIKKKKRSIQKMMRQYSESRTKKHHAILAPSSVLSQRVIHHTPPLIEVTLQHSRPLNR